MSTLVLQSHRSPRMGAWWQACLQSVQAWADARGYHYRFVDDALFDRLSPDVRARCADRRVIATDLARLALLQEALDEGHQAAVWCDADVYVHAPDRFLLPPASYALGRQVFVQGPPTGIRVYRQVHNAVMVFRRGNPFLAFYRHAATRIVLRHEGPMVPQLVGPKLLTALHNLVGCPVIETANMLPPRVGDDLRSGGGAYLDRYLDACATPPAAVNLCASLVTDEERMLAVIAALARTPQLRRER